MRFRNEFYFLSNFYPSLVRLSGAVHPTVEHAFQAAKTLSPEWRERIRNAKTPAEAKRLGKQAPLRGDWMEIRVEVMRALLKVKFRGELLERLRLINQPIVEDNYWHDTFWGVCQGRGANMLGKLLEEIRRSQS